MFTVPPVDLSLAADPAARSRQADLLDEACARSGVARVIGHGIPEDLQAQIIRVTRQFFDQPDEVKSQVAQPQPEQVRGWSGIGSEGIAYSLGEESHGDLKEKMDIGPVDPGRAGHINPMAYENLWPPLPRSFQAVWTAYFRHMRRVGSQLLSLACQVFELPENYFDDFFDDELSMLRALYFPPQLRAPLAGQQRAGIHTDYGAFTVISAEPGPGGLQVLSLDGEWIDIPTLPSELVVLVGDLLAEWTADHWRATVHRTANPPRGQSAHSSRLSFAFYQHPNHDVEVAELPKFARGSSHPGVGLFAGEHLTAKYLRQTTFGARW